METTSILPGIAEQELVEALLQLGFTPSVPIFVFQDVTFLNANDFSHFGYHPVNTAAEQLHFNAFTETPTDMDDARCYLYQSRQVIIAGRQGWVAQLTTSPFLAVERRVAAMISPNSGLLTLCIQLILDTSSKANATPRLVRAE